MKSDVECPFCGAGIDLDEKNYILVDSSNHRFRAFCNWKHLGRWVTEVYERGEQFVEKLEVLK